MVNGYSSARDEQGIHDAGSKAAPDDVGPLIFLFKEQFDSGGSSAKVRVADVNRDGKPDLLVLNCGDHNDCFNQGSVGVLLGNGDGTFQPAVTYGTGGFLAQDLAVADLNGDGKLDLVVANCGSESDCFGDGSVAILLGNGDGTFQPAAEYDSGGLRAVAVAVADVNGDGKADVVVLNTCSLAGGHNSCFQNEFSFSLLVGNGDGTFSPGSPYVSDLPGGISLALADVNKDGKVDLLIGSMTALSVFLGNGDGTFQAPINYGFSDRVGSIVVRKVNGDANPDVLIANWSAGVNVLLGNGDGTFQSAVNYDISGQGPPGGMAFDLAVVDVNGDGKRDLVVGASYGTSVLLGNGDGTFGAAVTNNVGVSGQSSLATADLNGDGRLDLLAVDGFPGFVDLFLNNSAAPPSTTSVSASSITVNVLTNITYTAMVTPQAGGIVNGNVLFLDQTFGLASVPLTNNQATFTTSYAEIGTHSISGVYSGDFGKATGSRSNTVTVNVRGITKTRVTTSGSPTFVGQPVTFTAKVSSKYGTIPDGELVTFYDGTTAMGSVALSNQTAAFTTAALSAKTHSIKATYPGDASFAPSTGTVRQVVNAYPTSTSLTSNPNPSQQGQAVKFTVQVTSEGPNTPTGKVKFMDGTTSIGSVTLSGGAGTLTKSNLTVGTHPITAHYSGDSQSAKSTSAVLNQVVQ